MSETIFSRVLALLQATGPEGIRTDVLAKQAGTSGAVLNNYLKRHRQSGVEIHTHQGVHCPATLYVRQEWYDAAKSARVLESAAKLKARERKRSQAKSMLAAMRREKAQAEIIAKRAIFRPAPKVKTAPKTQPKPKPKHEPLQKSHPKPSPVLVQHVGPLPPALVLPSQPVYSRHQLVGLPPGFQSPLSAAECRPWAMALGQ